MVALYIPINFAFLILLIRKFPKIDFVPSLFMGAMLGGTFGHIAHSMFPETVAPSGAYALVGMAAFFGGVAHAPITAILILFEKTGDYQIILPLMLATVVSTIVSRTTCIQSVQK